MMDTRELWRRADSDRCPILSVPGRNLRAEVDIVFMIIRHMMFSAFRLGVFKLCMYKCAYTIIWCITTYNTSTERERGRLSFGSKVACKRPPPCVRLCRSPVLVFTDDILYLRHAASHHDTTRCLSSEHPQSPAANPHTVPFLRRRSGKVSQTFAASIRCQKPLFVLLNIVHDRQKQTSRYRPWLCLEEFRSPPSVQEPALSLQNWAPQNIYILLLLYYYICRSRTECRRIYIVLYRLLLLLLLLL